MDTSRPPRSRRVGHSRSRARASYPSCVAAYPHGSRSVVFRLAHTRAFPIGHVTLGLLDRAFELRREFQFVLDQIIKPATDLTKLCLRKFAELAFHLLDFAHMQMIERILLNFKPGVSQSSLSVFRFLPGNQPRHRGYDVDLRGIENS